jgi:hypothetical protein
MAQVEHLPNKGKALSSSPHTAKKSNVEEITGDIA